MRHAHWLGIGLLAAASLGFEQHARPAASHDLAPAAAILDVGPSHTVPAGTAFDVALGEGLSSESARLGSTWSGTVRKGRNGIPSGSSVTGMVTAVLPARKDGWSMLDLELTSVTVEGRAYPLRAGTEAVIGGSSRAHALRAIANDAQGADEATNVLAMRTGDPAMRLLFRMLFGSAKANPVAPSGPREPIVLRPGVTLRFTTAEPVKVRAQG